MKKENVNLLTGKFDLSIKQGLSPLFSLAKIYVMYTGKNPNGSVISRESVERNIESLKNIPIVGEYIREDDNFQSHGGDLAIEDGEIRLINTTVPIGVVPNDARFNWETVIDDYGEEREYLVVENAFIWNRDTKMVQALKSDSFGQSMEINVTNGVEMNDGFFDIRDFYFTALCVLGIDKDGAGHVQPAFDNAKITTYSKEIESKEFAVSLNDMFKDFTIALNDMDKLVEEDKELKLEELLEKYSISLEDLASKVVNYEELTIEEVEEALSVESKEDELLEDETKEVVEDENLEIVEVVEVIEEEVVEVVEVEETEKNDEYEAKIKLLEEENAQLKLEVESLETQVTDYSRADHERVCNDKIAEFQIDYKLDEEIVKGLDVHEFETVEVLETKLFEIVGRLAEKEKFNKADENFSKIKKIEVSNKNKKVYSFEGLFEKSKK